MREAMVKTWLAYFLGAFLFGCAGPAPGRTPAEIPPAQAVPQQRPGETAELYLFNVSGWTLIPSNQEVTDNGQPLASLPRGTYKRTFIAPGVHELQVHGRKVKVQALAGRTHYVIVGYRPERSWAFPLAGDPVVIREISEEEGRNLIRELKPE